MQQKQTINQQKQAKTCHGVSYGRVSTDDQAFRSDGTRREDASPEAQKNRCLDHIRYRQSRDGIKREIIEHISDEGFSGKNTKRPGFQRMWHLVASGGIDFIVATELSRLSRSVFDFLELIEHCRRNKVHVFIIGLDLDTESPNGQLMLTILIALAQFEREITSQRVRENALSRLITSGKINGAAEILGLVRNSNNPGEFVRDEEGLQKTEKILNLFLNLSSKKQVLDAAKNLGLTVRGGKPLTQHILDIMFENVKWRYRGIWYANKENEHADPDTLPESKRYQIIKLPHGPLLDEDLLDRVQTKIDDTYAKKKKTGSNGWVYLLSHLLVYEDGSPFSGQPGKDRQYRYYYNRRNNIRIRCDEIDPIIIGRIKSYFKGNQVFPKLVERAIRQRTSELPKIEAEISRLAKQLRAIDETNQDLRQQLLDKNRRTAPDFMEWLEGQVREIGMRKERINADLQRAERERTELAKGAGLEALDRTVREFIDGFNGLTGVAQRELIEKIIEKIEVRSDNQLVLHVFEQPHSPVTWTQKSTERGGSGGASPQLSVLEFRPRKIEDFLDFRITPPYRDPSLLHQKYVIEGLSIAQIADQFSSSKEAVRKGILRAGIAVREAHLPHGRPSQPRYGQKLNNCKLAGHKAEHRVVEAIMEMRANKMGLRQIARCLSQMGVPTKCRGQKWHPEMVQRIIKAATG